MQVQIIREMNRRKYNQNTTRTRQTFKVKQEIKLTEDKEVKKSKLNQKTKNT